VFSKRPSDKKRKPSQIPRRNLFSASVYAIQFSLVSDPFSVSWYGWTSRRGAIDGGDIFCEPVAAVDGGCVGAAATPFIPFPLVVVEIIALGFLVRLEGSIFAFRLPIVALPLSYALWRKGPLLVGGGRTQGTRERNLSCLMSVILPW
jgi:hypothetical protein